MQDEIQDDLSRRRKIQYRAWHRGMREMDILFGRFFDARGALLATAELDDLEILMEELDRDLFMWLTGEVTVPHKFDTPVYRQICAFHTHLKPINL